MHARLNNDSIICNVKSHAIRYDNPNDYAEIDRIIIATNDELAPQSQHGSVVNSKFIYSEK